MVAVLVIAFLITCVALGVWWFSRTGRFRARDSGLVQGDHDRGGGSATSPPAPGSQRQASPEFPSDRIPRPGS
jgi:hypothetical protein